MTIIGAAFGAGLAVTLGIALVGKDRWLSAAAWSTLAFGWAVTVIVAPFGDRFLWVWPVLDLLFGAAMMWMGWRFRRVWPAVLALLYLGQCIMHIAYHYMETYGADDPGRLLRYYRAINGLLILQMLTVAGPGAYRGIALLVDRLRLRSGARDREVVARR